MCRIRQRVNSFITEPVEGPNRVLESCEGLVRSLERKGSCVGLTVSEGTEGVWYAHMSGCDDEDTEPVKFCPFCGTPLEVEVYDGY